MKPIKLVIKGLNSFIEEQTIDFNKLTDRGLFGIFGPTGSGKSTILDGITLALFGEVSRKSSNYINTNCDDLNVSFTFQISGAVNRVYVVSRQYKRDKKTGGTKTHAAMIKEITDGNEEILAESVTSVNKVCKEILGLNLDDFTRTVVLPQGKFSEFLKLEGKQRREMLERLFNLQDYGEKLTDKLYKQKKAYDDEANRLLGELKTYEDVSEEALEQKKNELAEKTKELVHIKKQQEEVEMRYKKGEEIWKFQSELANYKKRQQELEAKAEEIEEKTKEVKQAESAAKVYPYLERYEKVQTELELAKTEQEKLEVKQKDLTGLKENIEATYEKVNKQKEEQLPILQEKRNQLEETITEVGSLTDLEKELEGVQAGLYKLVGTITGYKEKEKELLLGIDKHTQAIQKAQEEEKGYKIEEAVRASVQEGLRLSEIYGINQSNMDKLKQTQIENLQNKKMLEEEYANLSKSLEEKQIELEKLLNLQQEQLQNQPITKEALLQKQEQLAAFKEKYVRLEKLKVDIQTYEANIKGLELQRVQLLAECETQRAELEKVQEEREKAKLENLAHLLRAKLQEGDCCPVCGSTSHHLEIVENPHLDSLEELEAKVKALETTYKAVESKSNEINIKLSAERAQLDRLTEEMTPLAELFKEQSMGEKEESINQLVQALNQYEMQKESFEKQITLLKEEKLKLEAEVGQRKTRLDETQKQLDKVVKEIAESQETLSELQETIEKLRLQVGTSDFQTISQEISAKDKKREEIASFIKEQMEEKDRLTLEKDKVVENRNKHQGSLGRGITQYDGIQKNRQQLLTSVCKRLVGILRQNEALHLEVHEDINGFIQFIKERPLLGELLKGKRTYSSATEQDELMDSDTTEQMAKEILGQWFADFPLLGVDIEELQHQFNRLHQTIIAAIHEVEVAFVEVTKQKEQISIQYEEVNKQLVENRTKCEEYTKRLIQDKENLEKQLREENLTELEVKTYLLDKEIVDRLKSTITQHQEEKARLVGSIEAIQSKLGNEKLDENEWQSLQEERNQILMQVEEVNKVYINLTTAVTQIEEKLTKLGELRVKKQELEHQIAILSDLEKLFKGKRFVEYVAITRLKYISLEASKKLREITNGIYGLEVDEDGKFIIRDYKNGGAQRDASTLSGGETFLASLALALALSAEIQLKGTAPLELFFLDEGFGTLDDGLLEIVMGALERIHHDKLKVGIISHVEAIKNRVPVKLILTPAEAGKGGTKVKLERS